MGSTVRGPAPRLEHATAREREVLRAVDLGLTNAEIAELLHISRRTVETHVATLMRKFDVHERNRLASLFHSALRDEAEADDLPAGRLAPVNVVELDSAGVVVAVNASWKRFCIDNDGDPRTCGVGVSYLKVCRNQTDRDSLTIAAYIELAVRGGIFVPLQTRIPCHSPTQRRYYDVLVASRVDDHGRCIGATVALCLSPRQRRSPYDR